VGLLSEPTTDFAGKYYQLSNARCEPRPVQRPRVLAPLAEALAQLC
jgi:alkanesulfonate monooxygenase SsuD/methylene tetrahydromethanopterin reductase-like flavin-dependent oxidoreductase (luciferase family)